MSELSELEAVLGSYTPSKEVAFTCSSGGKGVYLQAWNVANGAVLRRYTGDSSSGEATCVCMAGEDYILCALKHKPLIFVWRTHWEHVHLRIACTGIVRALACHPGAVYCVGAINDKINIWELKTGHLLAQLTRHYQDVTVLYFVDNGYHFLSGGKDGIVITWDLAKVLSQERLRNGTDIPNAPKPLKQPHSYSNPSQGSGTYHIWSDHSATVTGITSMGSGRQRRILTCSLDMNCMVYEFISGILLATYLFSSPLSCLIVSTDNLWLYTGSVHGQIMATPLFLPSSKQIIDTTSSENQFSFTLVNHKKSITGITFSANNNLVSSCEDGNCTVWDLLSKQVLRTLKHKGPVVGAIVTSNDALLSRSMPRFILNKHFGKQLSYATDSFEHKVPVKTGDITILSDQAVESLDDICGDDVISKFQFQPKFSLRLCQEDIDSNEGNDNEDMLKQLRELRDVHKKLYTFAMDKLIPS